MAVPVRIVVLTVVLSALVGCTAPGPVATPSPAPSPSPAVATAAPTATGTPAPTASAPPPQMAPTNVTSGKTGPLSTIAWSPDGALLATTAGDPTGSDATARVWTLDGTPLARLAGHGGAVKALAWSPDGQTLATGGADGSIRLWDRTGRNVRTLGAPDPVFSLAWSPDGALLAAGAIHFPSAPAGTRSALPGVINLWRPSGILERTLGTEQTGGKFLNLGWSPRGAVLVAGAIDYHAWRTDGTELGLLRASGPPAWAMAWSPNGAAVAIGDENGAIALVRPDGTADDRTQFPEEVHRAAYSADGTLLALGMGSAVELVRADHLRTVAWSAPSTGQGLAGWSPVDAVVAVASAAAVTLFSSDGRPILALSGCPGSPVGIAWSPAGDAVAAVTDGDALCLWRGLATATAK